MHAETLNASVATNTISRFATPIIDDIRPQEAFAFAALFTLHPFATEYFYYGEVTFATALAVFCAAVAVWSAYRAPPSWLWRSVSIGAVVLALGSYQVVIGHIAAGGLLVLVADLSVCDRASKSDLRSLFSRLIRRTSVLLAGFAVDLFCLMSTKYLFPAAASGRAFVPVHQISSKSFTRSALRSGFPFCHRGTPFSRRQSWPSLRSCSASSCCCERHGSGGALSRRLLRHWPS